MSDNDIDLERVVIDPTYRREVVERLNAKRRNNTATDKREDAPQAAVSGTQAAGENGEAASPAGE